MKTKAYGFTTRQDDRNYVRRIALEAKPKDQFLVATVRNVSTGEQKLTIFVRDSSIPTIGEFKLAGKQLTPNWGYHLAAGFRYRTQTVEDAEKATNIALNEIQRIKNFVSGRVVRVQVQAA